MSSCSTMIVAPVGNCNASAAVGSENVGTCTVSLARSRLLTEESASASARSATRSPFVLGEV